MRNYHKRLDQLQQQIPITPDPQLWEIGDRLGIFIAYPGLGSIISPKAYDQLTGDEIEIVLSNGAIIAMMDPDEI